MTQPLNENTKAVRFLDDEGVAHWFDIVEKSDPDAEAYELRYFRELAIEDGTTRADSYPVMPLQDSNPNSAWALYHLENCLKSGDVHIAEELAFNVAASYGQEFPEPLDLPLLDPKPHYYFGYGISPNNQPSLEAVKTWSQGGERQFETLTLGEYPDYADIDADEQKLTNLMQEQGLETAMREAEKMAVQAGFLEPDREDARLFFAEDAPIDLFVTQLQVERSQEMETQEFPALAIDLEDTEWFEANFEEGELLEPIDEIVNYALELQATDPETYELAVVKYWQAEDGLVGNASQTLQTYPVESHEQALAERNNLIDFYDNFGLEAMMHKAELAAMKNGYLDAGRNDLRLFQEGPLDPFETLAQRLEHEMNPYWNTAGETIEDFAKPEAEHPYWRLEAIPVNDPDGDSLGQAMHMLVFPHLEKESLDKNRTVAADEPFKMLEVAHFMDANAAQKFEQDFHSHIIPELLEGPELAEEVARLEGLPVGWKELSGRELEDYHKGDYTVTHNLADWHPYNLNAERDARIATEGIYHDPIYAITTFNEDADGQNIEPATPDFDL